MRRITLLAALFIAALAVRAQDVLTVGNGAALPGGTVAIPVTIRDLSATPLGADAGTGNRIQGFAFKVFYPSELIASVTVARAGIAASATPLFEATPGGSGWRSHVVSFSEPLPLPLNGAAPGSLIATLNVTFRGDAPEGSIAALTFDAPGAMLSNQAGSVVETVAAGTLAPVNGSVTVATLAAPPNLVATALDATQVSVTWTAVTDADHYEIWRTFNNGPWSLAGTASGTSFTDMNVSSGITYLYRVRAADAADAVSGFSNLDPATTIQFVNDPIVPGVRTIRAVHLTQLRAAINAFRLTAGLSPIPADPSINTAGSPVLATPVTTLRTALNEARTAVGLSPVAFSDGTLTPAVTVIKAVHVMQLRNGVR
jgi:hypothetical protein